MKRFLSYLLAIGLMAFAGCQEKEPAPGPDTPDTEYKVAMIFPQAEWENLKPVAEWALESSKAKLKLEWIDENGADFQARVKAVTHDNSCAAIIGPEYSANARLVARESLSYRIPVLMPMVTSTEFQRIYAESNKKDPNIFCLAQSDLSQCEVVLSKIKEDGNRWVFILSRDGKIDDYSASFQQYFPFIATEMGYLPLTPIYETAADMEILLPFLFYDEAPQGALFFVPSSLQDMLDFDKIIAANKGKPGPHIYCSDLAHDPSLEGKLQGGPYEGFSLGAEQSFYTSWKSRYGKALPGGYAQVYDCVSLVADAAASMDKGSAKSIREALEARLSGTYQGVSGSLHFAQPSWIAPEETIYQNWRYADGAYAIQGTLRHKDEGWDGRATTIMEPEDMMFEPEYEPQTGNFAVVLATSTGMKNYRHQADALAMYQTLKKSGYTDDNIILIVEDDIAAQTEGVVKVLPDGENVRKDAVIDYHLSDLSPDDFANILDGVVTEKTPAVVKGSKGTNVLLFWSGHGSRNGILQWGNGTVNDEAILSMLQKAEPKYRKMLVVLETCYSGSIAEACEGLPGILFLCAAMPGETSMADVYDDSIGTYLSNGFTRAFRDAITANPSITLYDLYVNLAKKTTGSHAGIYNNLFYGSVYRDTMAEYLNP
jgi:ABC-type branched-subunit amino acid transport system substrate-binding protein